MSFENLFLRQRRDRQREPARPGVRPLHRGRHPGNDGGDGRRLGRVRPLQRRRRQRHHQVGRQPVQRLVPRHAEQRQVAHADAVRGHGDRGSAAANRASTRSCRPTSTRSADRCCAIDCGSSRPAACRSRRAAATLAITNIPYTFTEDKQALRVQGHVRDRLEPPLPGRLHQSEPDAGEQHVQPVNLSMDLEQPGRPQAARGSVHGQLHRRADADVSSSRRAYSNRNCSLHRHRRQVHRPRSTARCSSTAAAATRRYWSRHVLRRLHPETARQRGHLRQGHVLPVDRGTVRTASSSATTTSTTSGNANNHQSGSDYRILGTTHRSRSSGASTSSTRSSSATARPSSSGIRFRSSSEGSNFRTHSVFFNDSWRVTDRLTANLGLRCDKNDGADQAGNGRRHATALFSPRLGVVWDPTGDGQWSVTGSVAKYVAVDREQRSRTRSSAGGNPQTWQFLYRGPSINPTRHGTLTPTPDAHSRRSSTGSTPTAARTCRSTARQTCPASRRRSRRLADDRRTPGSTRPA